MKSRPPIPLPAEPPEKRAERIRRAERVMFALPADEDWELLMRPRKSSRSDRQNNALFGLAYDPLSEHTGHTKDELHDHFLREFFGTVERTVLGKTSTHPRRTTTTNEKGQRELLSKAKFSEFFAFVQAQAADIGVWVDDPEPSLRVRAA